MAYTPPDAKLVELSFTGTYTAPDARLVRIDLIPPPIGSTQTLYPNAIGDYAAGSPTLTGTPAMAPAGFDAAGYGAPAVANLSQGVSAAGSEFAQFGTPEKVWNFHTFVRNITMQDQSLYGGPWASFFRRYLQMAGSDASLFGDVGSELQHRPVYPAGVVAAAFGSPTTQSQRQLVYPQGSGYGYTSEADFQLKTRYLSPLAFEGRQFGAFEIRYLTTVVAPTGFDAAAVPQAVVTDRAQHIYAGTVVQSALFEPPRVHNRNAYITPDSADQLLFPNFLPVVLNFTRELYPTSIDLFRSGTVIVANKAVAVPVSGADQNLYGALNITNWRQYREPAGFDAATLGGVVVALVQKVARPTGADALQFGVVAVTDKVRLCAVDPVDPPLDTTEPWVSHRVRTFGRYGGITGFAAGTPGITDGVRHVYPPTFYPSIFGTTDIILARRTLEPAGVFFPSPADAFGTPRLSPRVQDITPLGFYQEVVGIPAAARNEIALDSISAGDQTRFGTTQAELAIRVVQQKLSRDFAEFSLDARVWNWRQYASTWSPSVPDVLGTPYVENHNKQLLLIGTNFGKISSYLDVSNKARLVPTAGDDMSRFGDALVAPRIRTVSPTGYDAAEFGIWFIIHNTRQIIETTGIPRPYAGVPKVWRNEQVMDSIGGIAASIFGTTFVAPRIRTITQYRANDPVMGFPYVGLYRQYITPTGIVGGFGVPFVEHHQNLFKIFGSNYARYGEPLVRNLTPEILLTGIDAPALPAAPWVSFRVRPIDLAGQSPAEGVPGRPFVEFKTRTIYPLGYDQQLIPRTHDIRWDMPELPAQAVVAPLGIEAPGMPVVTVQKNSILITGFEAAKYGSVTVEAMSIWVNSTLCDFVKPGGATVTHRVRTIQIDSRSRPQVFEPSNVFVFPAYINLDASLDPSYLMDAGLANTDDAYARPFFGTVTVTNQHRSVSVTGAASASYGLPELRTNRIFLEGWDSNEGAYGFTDVSGPLYIAPYWGRSTEDYIPEVPAYNFDTAGYGEPTVHYPDPVPVYDPYLRPAGWDAASYGHLFLESSIRNLYPHGDDMAVFGTSWAHPPFRFLPEGIEPPPITIALIAPRIRTVYPQGDDYAVVNLEEAETISLRMRVRHGLHTCSVDGASTLSFGEALVADRVRTVRPLPVNDSTIQPARITTSNTFHAAGHDSAVLGVVRRAVFGELYPYGPDVQLAGYPKINRRASIQAIAPESIASPRIGRPIRPTGFVSAAFEAPAITNPYGCRDRVIIVDSGTDFATFGGTHATN